MGLDAGFDISPPLSTPSDLETWGEFLFRIRQEFVADDARVEDNKHWCGVGGIVFRVGEHPWLPYDGRKFRRFSAKITGSAARKDDVDFYLTAVRLIAKEYFGQRIKPWDQSCDVDGMYSWTEVREALGKAHMCECVDLDGANMSQRRVWEARARSEGG